MEPQRQEDAAEGRQDDDAPYNPTWWRGILQDAQEDIERTDLPKYGSLRCSIRTVLGAVSIALTKADESTDPSFQKIADDIKEELGRIRQNPAFLSKAERLAIQQQAEREALVRRCESPVEEMFVTAAMSMDGVSVHRTPEDNIDGLGFGASMYDGPMCVIPFRTAEAWVKPEQFKLAPQVRVKNYTLDFALLGGGIAVAVEVDGHAFHNLTREQVEHDRVRDRVLTRLGWHVVRFTAREVQADAIKCVREALFIADAAAVRARRTPRKTT